MSDEANLVDDVTTDAPHSPGEAVAEQPAAEPRPEWLGEFQTPEQLAAFAASAADVIRQQHQQLAEQEQLLAATRSEMFAEAPELAERSRALGFMDSRALEQIQQAAAANAIAAAVGENPALRDVLEMQVTAPQQHTAELTAALDEHVPSWRDYPQEVVASAPAVIGLDTPTVVQHVAQVVEQAKAQRELMAMRTNTMYDDDRAKRLAQTAVGAGGRWSPPGGDAEAWSRIVDAGKKGYWE